LKYNGLKLLLDCLLFFTKHNYHGTGLIHEIIFVTLVSANGQTKEKFIKIENCSHD